MNISEYKITDHALKRWAERCPDKNIHAYLESSRQNRYHPAAIRAIAGYKSEHERAYLVCHNGIVFVVSYEKAVPAIVTVLLPHAFVDQPAERDVQLLTVNELKKELKNTDKKLADITAIRSTLGRHKRQICERLNSLKMKGSL